MILQAAPAVEEIRTVLCRQVESLKQKRIQPELAVVLIGEDPGSVWYARNKSTLGGKLGVKVTLYELSRDVAEAEVLALIDRLNRERGVHGILIELPLPGGLNKVRILNAVSPAKDVDGITAVNRGYLLGGQEDLALVPATPLACLELLARAGVDPRGKRVTVVGRGDTVGRPLAALLLKRDATVTVCHTKTVDLAAECRRAEILISAAGVPGLIKAEMVAPGAVVIDAGINETPGGGITGDVDFESVKEIAGIVTPVPGGVGSLTTTMIFASLIKAMERQGL